MDPVSKEKVRSQVMDEAVFGQMVDQTFSQADLDKSGFIEKTELSILLKNIYASLKLSPPTEDDIEKELKRLDKNKDNKISKSEFRTLVKDLTLFTIEQL